MKSIITALLISRPSVNKKRTWFVGINRPLSFVLWDFGLLLLGKMPRRQNPVFLPSINEDSERSDEKIQDLKRALRIEKDEGRRSRDALRVRSAQDGDVKTTDSVDKPEGPTKKGKNPLTRTSSERNLDPWNRKRQGPGFANGSQRARTGLTNTRQKFFGFGQRKITSPRIDNGKQKLAVNDVPDTIDLTKPEDVQTILQRFYAQDLKMDSSDPRLTGSDDFIDSLRGKAQKKFSIGELWHGSVPAQHPSSVRKHQPSTKPHRIDRQSAIVRLREHQSEDSPGKIFARKLESLQNKPTFSVSYGQPVSLGSVRGANAPKARKVLTSSSFNQQPITTNKHTLLRAQPNPACARKRGKYLRPIKQRRPGYSLFNTNNADT